MKASPVLTWGFSQVFLLLVSGLPGCVLLVGSFVPALSAPISFAVASAAARATSGSTVERSGVAL
jgi:hypothetical protein